MRVLIGIVLVAGLGVVALWKAGFFEGAAVVDSTRGGAFTVQRGDLRITLTERGTLKTRNAQQVRSQVQGRTPIQWLADEGKRVTKGEVVVELDRTELEREIEDQQTLLIQLESEERAARTEVLIQEEQNKTDIEKAELELEVAIAEEKMFLEGDMPMERRRLDLAVTKTESDRIRAEQKLEETIQMHKKTFVTDDKLEQTKIDKEQAVVDAETAKQELGLYLEYQLPLDLKQKRSAVVEAQRSVERARKQAEARLEQRNATLNQKVRNLNRTRESLNERLADLENMTIAAPADGVVVYGDPDRSWDAEEIKVGGDAYFERVILTIPDSTEMAVTIQVHEADIRKIKEGMRAIISSELQRGKTYEGTVAKIDSVANAGNRRWGDTVRRFRVEVQIDGTDLDLKPGTTASVEVQIGSMDDVLHVPIQAVHAKEGRFFCYVRTPQGPKEQRVQIGRSNDAFLEVIEGLEEGQEVLLYEPEPASVERDQGESGDGAAGRGDRGGNRTGGDRPRRGPGGGNRGSGPGRPQP